MDITPPTLIDLSVATKQTEGKSAGHAGQRRQGAQPLAQ